MTFIPKVLVVREDLYALCGSCYLEAILLHRFLKGDFDDLTPYRMEDFHKDVMQFDVKSSKPKIALTRLSDKGYIKKVYSMHARTQMNKYQVIRDTVNRDLMRLGFPAYDSHVTKYAD